MKNERSISSKLSDIELVNDNGSFKILYQGRAFVIGKVLFEIVEHLKKGFFLNDIIDIIYKNGNYEIEKITFKECLETEIRNLSDLLEGSSIKKQSSYIKFQTCLLPEKYVGNVAKLLTFFFKRSIFLPIFIFGIFFHLYHAFYSVEITDLYTTNWLSISNMVLVYVIAMLFLLFHELGHATAAKYFKVKPKHIGFGFYLIFPVFFADVTAVWKLDKYKRIKVNLGGVYFQFITNIFLLVYLCFFSDYSQKIAVAFTYLLNINIAVMLYALSPFFKNDGYWIYSDFFELPNLNDKANSFFKDIFKLKSLKIFIKKIKTWALKEWALAVYSISNVIVMIFFFILFLNVLTKTFYEVVSMSSVHHNMMTLELFLKVVFLLIATSLLFYNYKFLLVNVFDFIRFKFFSHANFKFNKHDKK